MGLEMLLFLAVSAAGTVALGAYVYRKLPDKILPPVKIDAVQKEIPTPKPVVLEAKTEPDPPPAEAPSPFPEDSSFSATKSIAAPTDTTAIGSGLPFVSIPIPKNYQNPATKARRKRRAGKARTIPATLTTSTKIPVPTVEPTTDKDASAA